MLDFENITVDCKNDCENCDQQLECEFLLAETEEEKSNAKQKLIERENAKESALKAEAEEVAMTEEIQEVEETEEQATEETTQVEEMEEAEETQEAEVQETEEAQETQVEETEEEVDEVLEEETNEEDEQAEDTNEDLEEEDEAEEDEEDSEDEEVAEEEETAEEENQTEPSPSQEETSQTEEVVATEKPKKEEFKLTPPENLEELFEKICAKRGRKLIYRPNEVLFEGSYKVLGTDKKNEEGIKVKNILDAEIKQGVKLGYLDKYDGLKSSEIKEEYENDILYEFAEQEFKKTGLILENGKIKVYVFDWDGKALHHVGYVDSEEASGVIPFLEAKEEYSFDVCGIITGGKAKRVIKGDDGKIKIVKEKDGDIGLEVDVSIVKRKD